MKSILLLMLFTPGLCAAVAEPVDTAMRHRELAEFEVVGAKQPETSELAPVTYIGERMVQRHNINSFAGVSEIAPNFYKPDYGTRMTSAIYVRGLGSRMDQPVVGLNVDNVPIMNKDAYDFDIADIRKIEVLRGARALLNGRNAMGGQINITTLSPFDYEGWRVSAGYGRNNDMKSSAGWYHRFSDKAGLGVTASYNMNDGYYTNDSNGAKVGVERGGSLRCKAEWRLKPWLSLSNTAAASITRQSGYPYELLSTGRIAYNDTCFYRRGGFSDGLTVVWAGKRVVVTSISSVQYIDDNMTLDQDFMPDDYFTLTQKRREWTVTEDLFAKGSRGKYEWLGGVFAFSKSGKMDAPVTFKDTGIERLIENHRNDMNPDYPIAWDERQFVLGSDFRQSSRGVAVYHESCYKAGRWLFQLGLRLDYDRVGLDYHSHCNTGYETYKRLDNGAYEPFRHSNLDINDRGKIRNDYLELLPKIAAGYETERFKAYASVSKAYKAGGYNTQMFSDVLQQRLMQYMGLSMAYDFDEIVGYKPEKSWNYEAGIKSSLDDGRLTVDAVLFLIDCHDQQLTMFPPGMTTGRIMTNAGHTYSKGVEASAMWNVSDAVVLRGSYGFAHATFARYADARGDYKGKRLPYAPMHTLFASADWHLPWHPCGTSVSVGFNVKGAGNIYWDEANTVKQPFYALLGASALVEKDIWSVSLWGENISSTHYDTFYFVSMDKAFVQRGLPWRAGVTLRFNFMN